jgi:flagellar M-ring protein FliF
MTTPLGPAPILDLVRRGSRQRRLLVLAAVATILAGAWLVVVWATAPTWVTLYRGLELAEVGRITSQLEEKGIPHRLGGGGSDVQVPVDRAPQARVLLAQQGLPTAGRPGLELFDKPTWGMTDFTQRITYRRALEGELERTIGLMQGISKAQVHLSLPESAVFRQLERPAQAAVVLSLRPGLELPPEAIRSITYLVSSSVERLSADQVAVLDDAGRLLATPDGDSTQTGIDSRHLELQKEVERRITGKVERSLNGVLGSGRARVQVTAELNFERIDRTIETFDPEGQVLQSEERGEVSTNQPATTEGGPSTVMSNKYQNSRTVERVVGGGGGITRLTVAAVVDAGALGGSAAGGPRPGRPELEALVRDAAGLDTARGDRLTILAVPFADTAAVAPPVDPAGSAGSAQPAMELVSELTRPVLAGFALLVTLILGWRALRFRAPPAASLPALSVAHAERPALIPTKIIEPPDADALLRMGVAQHAENDPDTAVRVLRAWLAEGA